MWEYETLWEFEKLSAQEKIDKIIKMLEQAVKDKVIRVERKHSKPNRNENIEPDVNNNYFFRENLIGVKSEKDMDDGEERLAVFCVIDKKCEGDREHNYAFIDKSLYIDKIQPEDSRVILNYTLGKNVDTIKVFGDNYDLFLHQFVFYPNYHPTVDHISHNKRVNIKSLLRVCDIAENNANKKTVKISKKLDDATFEKFKYRQLEDFSETWYVLVYWKVMGSINKEEAMRYQEEYFVRKNQKNMVGEE